MKVLLKDPPCYRPIRLYNRYPLIGGTPEKRRKVFTGRSISGMKSKPTLTP